MQPHGDQANACPGVEPSMQEAKLGRTGRELEEAERDAEGRAAMRDVQSFTGSVDHRAPS
jgi:hypothetical protein